MAHNLITYELFKIHTYIISLKVFGPSCHAIFMFPEPHLH